LGELKMKKLFASFFVVCALAVIGCNGAKDTTPPPAETETTTPDAGTDTATETPAADPAAQPSNP
jgi:hypothetical protein